MRFPATCKFLPIILLLITACQLQAQNARDIVDRSERLFRGESSRLDISMQLIRPTWEREVRLKAWFLGDDYSLVRIEAPARDRGTAYLKRFENTWNWIPRLERSLKLPPSMMMQAWMGSDFRNDDIIRESSTLEDYTHHISGTENLREQECWKIEMQPKEDAAVVWGKIILWVAQDGYFQLRSEYYDDNGLLVNTLDFFDIKDLGGRTLPTRLVMTPAEEQGQQTVLRYLDADFGIDLSPEFFSLQNLEQPQ